VWDVELFSEITEETKAVHKGILLCSIDKNDKNQSGIENESRVKASDGNKIQSELQVLNESKTTKELQVPNELQTPKESKTTKESQVPNESKTTKELQASTGKMEVALKFCKGKI
jgi:hypothetical protein